MRPSGRRGCNVLLALDVCLHSLVAGIAAMSASTAGLDVLVFTGGVGENSSRVRRLAAQRLAYFAVAIDAGRNNGGPVDRDLSSEGRPSGPSSSRREKTNRSLAGPAACSLADRDHRLPIMVSRTYGAAH